MEKERLTPATLVVHEIYNGRSFSYSVGDGKAGINHTMFRVMTPTNKGAAAAKERSDELVRRWNCHEDLVAAIKALTDNNRKGTTGDQARKAWHAAAAALSKASPTPSKEG